MEMLRSHLTLLYTSPHSYLASGCPTPGSQYLRLVSGSSAGHRFLVRDGVHSSRGARPGDSRCSIYVVPLILSRALSTRARSEHWHSVIEEAALLGCRKALKTDIAVLEENFELLAYGKAEEWVRELQLDEGGGSLIRPDQHILETWREVPTAGEVFNTLAEHLGL